MLKPAKQIDKEAPSSITSVGSAGVNANSADRAGAISFSNANPRGPSSSMATVFNLTAKINAALQKKKMTDAKKKRLSRAGWNADDSDFNMSDYEEESDESGSD